MFYRPNFCAECGERVAGARRRWLYSRRFCTRCARRFRRARLIGPLALALILYWGGFLAGRAGRATHAPPPEGRAALGPVSHGKHVRPAGAQGGVFSGARPAPAHGPDGSEGERPTDPAEVVSVCGARTKKGTPCQRRVRGEGRCWQHRGKPAVLPPSKLIVKD